MVNRQKIIAMTKLALYDKHEGTADHEANEYFRHDYIYRKNLWTRIAVGFAGFIILAINCLRIIVVDGIDVFELDIQTHVYDAILFIIAIVAVYSVIGTIQGTREYHRVQKRLGKYQAILSFLEGADNPKKPETEDDELTQDTGRIPEQELRREARTRADELRARRELREQESRTTLDELRSRHEQREQESQREPMTRADELRARRGQRDRPDPYARQTTQNRDPLANVSSRAISTTRPRSTSALNRPTPRPSTARNQPLYRLSENNDNNRK